VLIGGGGERKTLRLVATYADACNLIGDASIVAHKVGVLRRHCEQVGRDPADIEVTALALVPEDSGTDVIVEAAKSFAQAGAHTLVVRLTGPNPTRWLEETWGPVVPALASMGNEG
jgi:alkanesulfonate monooxygenase SsuD/methylene tetrahydromethanopterin reductase-like flavin-dependent oxidoreductase (luciferase family)